jgi:hypothetical protein
MQVQHYQTNLGALDLNAEERRLLLWSMVALNEINLLYSCVAMSQTDPRDTSPLGLARQSQTLFFLTLLAGKLSEAWDAFERDFAESQAFSGRLPYLPSAAQKGYGELREYFGNKKNPIRMMRNWVSFHYGEELRDALSRLPDKTLMNIWVAPNTANARFDVGSEAASIAMNEAFSRPQGTTGYECFLRDVLRVLGGFGLLLSALVVYLLGSVDRGRGHPIEVPGGGSLSFAPFLDAALLKPFVVDNDASGFDREADRPDSALRT